MARITRDTEDPPGGKFLRDDNGELTGLLQERAAGVVRAAGPRTPDAPEADTLDAYRECYRQDFSRGITSVHVAGTSPGSARLMEKARTAELPLRFYFMFREANLETAARRRRESGSDPDDIRFGAIKLFHGNSLSAQTCWLSKPYAHRPDYFGVPPARSQAALNQLILSVPSAAKPQPNGVRPSPGAGTSAGATRWEPSLILERATWLRPGTGALRKVGAA